MGAQSPGVMLKNKSGRNVIVPVEWRERLIKEGFEEVNVGLKVLSAGVDNVLVHRPHGGLGDMICIIPTIKELAKRYKNVTFALPERYWFLFKDFVKVARFNDLAKLRKSLNPNAELDLWCPAGLHENATHWRPTRNRVQNFADTIEYDPPAPLIAPDKETIKTVKKDFKDKKIGFQLVSANRSKDWPIDNYKKLAEALVKKNYHVFSFDECEPLNVKGVVNKIRMTTEKAVKFIGAMDLVVAPDSGLMWAALAQGVKTVALFGPTNGALTLSLYDQELWRVHQIDKMEKCHVPCYYNREGNQYHCFRGKESVIGDCMKEITVDQVLESIKELL